MIINGFETEMYNVRGFPEKAKNHTCPKCSADRKKSKDKCLSIFWETGLGYCNHFEESVQLHTWKKKEVEKIYVKPILRANSLAYSDKLINYTVNIRGVDLIALKALKIREQKEWMPQTQKEENCICFDNYLNGELVNVKYRDGKKNFKLHKGSEKIFYNLDNIAAEKTCVIVEGEFDVLAYRTAGVTNVVSVPNGFNLQGSMNLDYIDNYNDYFDNKESIYIAVDNDPAGQKGQAELIRRFGADKCKIVNFNDCKDANEYLLKHGKESLANTIKLAKDVKIEGVFTAKDSYDSMINGYRNGQKRGEPTGFQELDKAWTWRSGEVTVWTGYQNEGKSLMLNQLALIKAINNGDKVAVFSPENMPLDDFYNDLIETYIGKSCDPYYSNNYMSEEEYELGIELVNKYFFLIHPSDDFKLNTIFEKAKSFVKKQGIRTLIIDPYNTIEHIMKSGEREDLYISSFMRKLKSFALENDVSVHLVAHQNTARKNDKDDGRYYKPELNNIKGGGTFADKADNVIFIWRPNRAINFKSPDVWFGSQKIKKQKLVGVPQDVDCITFNVSENRYYVGGYSPFTLIDKIRNGTDKIEKLTIEEYKPEPKILQDAFADNYDEDSEMPF
jgi:twinkle protein